MTAEDRIGEHIVRAEQFQKQSLECLERIEESLANGRTLDQKFSQKLILFLVGVLVVLAAGVKCFELFKQFG